MQDSSRRNNRLNTHNSIKEAMAKILNKKNFNDITVNDLCSQASICRATFYAHFDDKYRLLEYFLSETRKSIIKDVYNYDELEVNVNEYIEGNKKLITNVVKYANSETLELLRAFMASIVKLTIKRETNDKISTEHKILFNFFVGGLVYQLIWLVDNKFPKEIKMMNPYLYEMLAGITLWDANLK